MHQSCSNEHNHFIENSMFNYWSCATHSITLGLVYYLTSLQHNLMYSLLHSGQLQTHIHFYWSPWLLCHCSSSGGLHLCIIHSGNEQCSTSVPCSSSKYHHPTWCDWSNICGNHSCWWILHCCWKLLPRTDHRQEWRRWCNVSLEHHACTHRLPYVLLILLLFDFIHQELTFVDKGCRCKIHTFLCAHMLVW